MKTISNYDKRQIDIMIYMILEYEEGKLSLSYLSSRLKEVINSFEELDDSIIQNFLRQRGVVEKIYASMIDKEKNSISVEEQSRVQSAMQEMRRILSIHTKSDI